MLIISEICFIFLQIIEVKMDQVKLYFSIVMLVNLINIFLYRYYLYNHTVQSY